MSLTFALDCTNGNFTAALTEEGRLIDSVNHYPFKEAAEYVAIWLRNALEEQGLEAKNIRDYISVAGPGGFSGVRTGTSMISAMALVTGGRIKTLSSLEALALSSDKRKSHLVVSCLNAKRNGVYIGAYRDIGTSFEHVISEQLLDKDQLQDFCIENFKDQKLILCGHGHEIIAPYFGQDMIIDVIDTSDAALFIKNADLINSSRAHAPLYLRAADAAIGKKKFDTPRITTL